MPLCITDGCDNNVNKDSKHEHCVNCRANFRYWGKNNKRPAEVLYRRRRLSLFTNRLEQVIQDRDIKGEK